MIIMITIPTLTIRITTKNEKKKTITEQTIFVLISHITSSRSSRWLCLVCLRRFMACAGDYKSLASSSSSFRNFSIVLRADSLGVLSRFFLLRFVSWLYTKGNICVHTHVHIYMNMYIYIDIILYMYIYIYLCVCICACVCEWVCVFICSYACMLVHLCTSLCACVKAHTRTDMHVYPFWNITIIVF